MIENMEWVKTPSPPPPPIRRRTERIRCQECKSAFRTTLFLTITRQWVLTLKLISPRFSSCDQWPLDRPHQSCTVPQVSLIVDQICCRWVLWPAGEKNMWKLGPVHDQQRSTTNKVILVWNFRFGTDSESMQSRMYNSLSTTTKVKKKKRW